MIPYKSHKLTQRDMQEIVSLYPNETVSTEQIADKYDVSMDTIYRVLHAAGIDTSQNKGQHTRKLFPQDIDEIVRLYTTPAPDGTWRGSTMIAERFGVTDTTIRRWLRKRNVEIRSLAEAHAHGKQCKPRTRKPPEDEQPPLCKCGCGQRVKWDRSHDRWYKYIEGHYHKPRPYHRKEWLEHEYIDKQRSTYDIGEQFDVSPSVIRKFMLKHGIERRTQPESLRLSGAVAGPNNPAWKGGVAEWDYAENWKSLCKLIKDRDEWTCQLCGEQRKRWGHNLHVHHIDEDKTNNHPHNLIALCSVCHYSAHDDPQVRKQLRKLAISRTKDVSKYIW